MDLAEIHEIATKIHQDNASKVVKLIQEGSDLHDLDTVLHDPVTSEVYLKVLPRYAELCDLNQKRRLATDEHGELVVDYASLFAQFGDKGTVRVAAAWLAAGPLRQARGS